MRTKQTGKETHDVTNETNSGEYGSGEEQSLQSPNLSSRLSLFQ